MSIFKEKKPFQKTYRIIDTEEDYEMSQKHRIAFWSDPSRKVLSNLFAVLTTSREELDKMDEDELRKLNSSFYDSVSQIILDVDIEGLDFSDAKAAEESFENKSVDANFFFDALVKYIDSIVSESRLMKKK